MPDFGFGGSGFGVGNTGNTGIGIGAGPGAGAGGVGAGISGGRPPMAAGNAGLAAAFSGLGQQVGSRGQFSSGPMGRGITGNALANSILSNDFTTPYSLADSISIISPTLGKLAGLLGGDSIISTGPPPSVNSDRGLGVGRLGLGNASKLLTTRVAGQPTIGSQKIYNPKKYADAASPFGTSVNGLTPEQIGSGIAIGAIPGDLSYFANAALAPRLFSNGKPNTSASLLPTEYSYLQRQGLNVNHDDVQSVLDALFV